MKIPQQLAMALAVILALILVRECGYQAGAKDAQARAVDARTDSVVLKLRREAHDSGLAIARERDSTGREIARLKAKIPQPSEVISTESEQQQRDTSNAGFPVAQGASVGCAGAPAQCDTLIDALTAGRTQDSLQLLFWQGQVSARDSLIPRLTAARDSWRKRAERPSYTVTDVGGGALVGYGVADKCSACVVAGAATILLPRAWGLVRRIL